MSVEYVEQQLRRAIATGQMRDFIERLPGCPNTDLILRSRAFGEYQQALKAEELARSNQALALSEIADEFLEDWSEDQLLRALQFIK